MASTQEHEEPGDEQRRIVLVGKTGAGKSAAGNTILQKKAFVSKISLSSLTPECQKETAEFKGQSVAVVDTPGLYDTNNSEGDVIREIAKCISLSSPGPHVFLVVIQPNRFTKEEQETVKLIQKIFGDKAAEYTVVLFTHGDDLEADGVVVDDLIKGSDAVRAFIDQCGGRYHLFNNRSKDPSQVEELLKKINEMVEKNDGSCFTNEIYQEVERAIQEEMQIILRDNPHMTHGQARGRAEIDNCFIREIMEWITAGASIGYRVGEPLGPLGATITTSVGALVGSLVGNIIATIKLSRLVVNQIGCILQ